MITDDDLPILLTISLTHLRVVARSELGDSVAGSWTDLQARRAIHELGHLRHNDDPNGDVIRGVQDMLEDLVGLLSESGTLALASTILDMSREVIGEDPLF